MNTTIAGIPVPATDLCHLQWRSIAWVLEHGPLTEANAMDYFMLSPFYDRRSTNQQLRMQSMYSGQPQMDPAAERDALRKFKGIEFALVLSRPEADREGGLFVVEKRQRKEEDEYYPIASYYILKTCIYQSPSLHATLSARVLTSLSVLSELLTLARAHKPTYDSRQGYAWRIKEKTQPAAADSSVRTLEPEGAEMAAEPSHESDAMDIDPAPPAAAADEPVATKPAGQSTELFNPILFRSLQNTATNFSAFKPAAPAEPVPPLPSRAASPSNPTQLSAVSSGSNVPSPSTMATMCSSQLAVPPRRGSVQDPAASPNAGSPKGGQKPGAVAGKRKPKRVT